MRVEQCPETGQGKTTAPVCAFAPAPGHRRRSSRSTVATAFWSAFSRVVMLKTMKCQVRVVWIFRKSRYVALLCTDLSLGVEQIIEYYGARWKIESGFKEIKQEIGSSKTQTRHADAVGNHLHFCMMATTLTWIYADRLQKVPDRRHKIRGRAGFAFSDVRRILAEAALDPGFQSICPRPAQTPRNSFVDMLLRMVA